ncbi:MAG: exonuclease subunit SbcC [Limnospira sp.]
MIPQKLILKNFLSYRDASLDFSGLHTACICGPNGAGKSSLLEAIAWSVWGNSRAGTEDDLIQIGEKETRVDFTFISHGSLYRVIRSRRRSQSATLEFQIAPLPSENAKPGEPINFRPLTEKGVRATQQKILEHLRLDYDTFINSAYLRQGRADEFMLKRPGDRKEILASLLKLDEYDTLAERARDLSRQYKGQIDQLENNLKNTEGELQNRDAIAEEIARLETEFAGVQERQNRDREQLQHLRERQQHRQTWEQLIGGQQQQHRTLAQECDRLQREIDAARTQVHELDATLGQADEIKAGTARYQTLQAAEENLSARSLAHQTAREQLRGLQDRQQQQIYQLQRDRETLQTRLDSLTQQEQEYRAVLTQQPEVEAGLAKLHAARLRLNELDRLQVEVTPLLQRYQRLQGEVDRAQARLSARLEELYKSVGQLRQNLQHHRPDLENQFRTIEEEIVELEKKRNYLTRVQTKGQERHNQITQLNNQEREYEEKLAEIERKMSMLGQSPGDVNVPEQAPLCPLCDRPLDEHHWNLVVGKHRTQQQEIRDRIWVIREETVRAQQDIEKLREEYRQLNQELSPYEKLREKRVQIQARLDGLEGDALRLQELGAQATQIERSLQTGEHAAELYSELRQLDRRLQEFDYNEQSHALARTEEKNLRWAEIKQSKIRDAQEKLARILAQKPELEAQIRAIREQLHHQETDSELKQKIAALEEELGRIGYSLEEHDRVRSELRQAAGWLRRAEQLDQAKHQHPQLQGRLLELEQLKLSRSRDLEGIEAQINALQQQLQDAPDLTHEIEALEQNIRRRRQELDGYLSRSGQLKQQQTYLERLDAQKNEQKQQLQKVCHQQKIYQELAQAFGKNGIQALMIENVLPQLEAESNQILSRLSANQLHVQFVTQRAGRSGSAKKKNSKLIDTLDILIADARGTRPYETYSGGEAFRINFAIRLALAKLLAQRAGTALQMLIIDEGFGTQDAEGCDRLIAAINAIAPDFSCILAVTHIPHLKEAFQAKIEVSKLASGSQIRLSI